MIQEKLMDILKEAIPGLSWTIDYRTEDDNTGTVYLNTGSDPDKYDPEYRYPSYQVYIRSGDWDYAKAAAEITFDELHKRDNFKVTTSYERDGITYLEKRYHVFQIVASSDILSLGNDKGIMEYSVNFDVTLREEK